MIPSPTLIPKPAHSTFQSSLTNYAQPLAELARHLHGNYTESTPAYNSYISFCRFSHSKNFFTIYILSVFYFIFNFIFYLLSFSLPQFKFTQPTHR